MFYPTALDSRFLSFFRGFATFIYKRYCFTSSFSFVFLCIHFISLKRKDKREFIPLSVFNIQLIFQMLIHVGK